MTTISYDAIGQAMVPSGAADGHSVPISQPGASDLARLRKEREQEAWRAQEEHRRAVRTREDVAYERRMKEANAAREAERREAAEATAAAKRVDVENELRLNGAAESQVTRLADETMAGWHRDQAREAADRGGRSRRELEDYFRRQPAPAFDDGG